MNTAAVSSRWKIFLLAALIAGTLLRTVCVRDMEYKEDEIYDYSQSQVVGTTQPWPWAGIASGVYILNPGMSVWVFAALAKVTHARQPTELAHALQGFSLLGILLVIPFALYFVNPREREPWFWAFALAMVNPFAIYYQRKLWPEPFLPFFSMLFLMGWWRREKRLGAFAWGFIGAILGQIHMSGFFLAGGLALWTLIFGHRETRPRWRTWILGSTLGALPLIPWAILTLSAPPHEHFILGWKEISQLKYWVFWITDPTGLTLGNPLGLLRGQSNFAQISDFIRYPLWNGQATYLIGLAHVLAIGAVAAILSRGILFLWHSRGRWKALLIGSDSETAFAQNAILIASGILMTATGIMIRRYYMMVTFPLEFIWLVRAGYLDPKRARFLLGLLWAAECAISAGFVNYVHVNGGSTQGDYGVAYHLVVGDKRR